MLLNANSTDTMARRAMHFAGIWIPLLLLVVALVQWSIPSPLDDDTAYHFAVARLIREHGILHGFPWTRFSWQADHYADKEFLFHLLFVPFTGLGYNTASRIVGTICGGAILSAIFFILRAERVRFTGCWALLPLGTAMYLYRFSQVRPHLVSIALALLLLWACVREQRLLLFTTAFLYPLCYVAFWQIPLLLLAAAEGGRLLSGGGFSRRTPLIVLAGLAAGVALHPNSLTLLQINWIHMSDILMRNAWGKHLEFNLGEEFEPFTLQTWLETMVVPTLTALYAVQALRRPEKRRDALQLAATLAMLVFFLLTLRTNRFIEYFVPLAVVAAGLACRGENRSWPLPLLAGLSLLVTLLTGTPQLRYIFGSEPRPWQLSPATAAVLRREVPVGAKVFTCGWEYTGTLLTEVPDRSYLVALDPTLLYKHDPGLYDLWYRTLRDAPPTAADVVRSDFASRYVICLDHPTLHPFFDALLADGSSRVLSSDGKWVAFDLGSATAVQP